MTRDAELMAYLAQLGIVTTTISHAPVYTVEEAQRHREGATGSFIKNLFLRNKKTRMFLVVVPEDRRVDLKRLAKRLDAGHLSFGSPQRLRTHLGVEAGAVTPLAAFNDRDQIVQVVIDQAVFAHDPVHCHPLRNDMTTAIAGNDLVTFLRATGHDPLIADLNS